MKKYTFFSLILSGFFMLSTQQLTAINTRDTRMLQQPSIGGTHVAFIYANDLWTANTDGSDPRRLTADEGTESSPFFSPDGKWIAFSAEYDGNVDVFLVPAEGGIPQRLTWHPAADLVRGFMPDGKSVLFASPREDFSGRYTQLFTVPVGGGFPDRLIVPNAYQASYSPDGNSLVYSPIPPRYQQWKNYRGGTVSTLLIFNLNDHSTVKIPQPEGRCNDSDPMWIGGKIYFRSDRNGEFNLFSYEVATQKITQLTRFSDFPIVAASAGNDRIVFEQAGYLHIYDLKSGKTEKLTIGISAELLELRSRFVKGNNYIRSAAISPSGARAVFGIRGEIITVPAEKGDARNITGTAGASEKYPSWSPDGKSIAFFSDESGEYKLCIKPQDGKGEARIIPVNGTGFYAYTNWSPDSKYITFSDNGRNLYLLEVLSGRLKKIDADDLYTPGSFRNLFGDWSSDSKWIAYTKVTDTYFKKIYLYSLSDGKSYPLTDGLSDTDSPIFSPEGKYLFFFASTNAGPVINWFDLSSADMRSNSSVYLITLQKELPSPFAKESDEEKIKEEGKTAEKPEVKTEDKNKDDKGKPKEEAKPAKEEKVLKIDLDGIQQRTVDVPLRAGNYSQLNVTKEGEFYYVAYQEGASSGKLFKYDLKEKKETEVTDLDEYYISADRKKMLFRKGGTWTLSDAGKKPEPGKGNLNTAAIEIKIDPAAEWKQIFDEAWRINRDYFYDPKMHGADWPKMKEKYAVFLPDVPCRNDLNRLIQWMCSELSVGHHRVGGGDQLAYPERVGVGLLGADYEVANNRFRLKKIYGGLNWNPSLRAPLTEPGINARTGDYIISINGKNVTAEKNLYSYFENTAGKIVELTIGPNPDGTGSRVVKVEPITSEFGLRNRDWVEGNLKKVTEATNGKVAYVYVPNTSSQGHEYFKRYFYPQADRDAIIVDERFNGGGLIADYYINLLTRPYQSNWNMRYGIDLKTPSASIQGPKVMIIDETAGSGGDMLPWMFRKFQVGTLVGKRTWGGLVGILGFPELMDGGSVTAPNLAIWTKDGFVVENVGVEPDIEVEMTPSEVIKGKDPQLEKAIQVALDALKKNPVEKSERPAYPVKVRK